VSSELRDAHGFSRGVLNLVVLPADEPFRGTPAWTIGVAVAAFFLLALIQPRSIAERGAFIAEAAGMAMLLVVAVAPAVTSYRVVLAPRTFVLCAALVSATRLIAIARLVPSGWMPALAGALGAAFFGSALLQTSAAFGWNYSGFLHLDRNVAARAPYLVERPDLARSLVTYDAGYDGQFMYLMAFDPLLRRFADRPAEYAAFIDSPPYRYGRIGFSALTALVSGGRPERYPAVICGWSWRPTWRWRRCWPGLPWSTGCHRLWVCCTSRFRDSCPRSCRPCPRRLLRQAWSPATFCGRHARSCQLRWSSAARCSSERRASSCPSCSPSSWHGIGRSGGVRF
jgi:hypothetical protein